MKIVERTAEERGRGEELGQLLAGGVGAMFTTLPAFIVLPMWLLFIRNNKILKDNGEEDDFVCGLICFVAGIIIWAFGILITNIA